jgi:hypothetical protein
MSHVHKLGTKLDIKQRETLARVDDDDRRRKVQLAREIIYDENYAVDSNGVEELLKPQSLVPTSVSVRAIEITFNDCSRFTIECLFNSTELSGVQPVLYAPCRYPARVRTRGMESTLHPLVEDAGGYRQEIVK